MGESVIHYLDLTELAARIRSREISPVAATRGQLDRIAALDGTLRSYALVMGDPAMAQAEAAEKEIKAGSYRGPLHGVPLAVKDLCDTAGFITAGGMAIHQNRIPAEDATVVRRLQEAGAVLLGKLQLTEGAYSDHHPCIEPPRNPWHAEHWPGMSSSGSGVATAAGLCYGSLGSDTGGSIRFPCAANGLTGLKPSWGRVSRHGVLDLAPSLDHVGPMARSAVDAGVLLGVIAGADANDPTASLDPVPDYLAAVGQGIRGLRIGIDAAFNCDGVGFATETMLADVAETFRALGARMVDVRLPDVTQAVADWFPLCAVEAAVAHAASYPARKDEYGPVLASVVDAGLSVSGVDLQRILLRRMNLRGRMAEVFCKVDVLLIPVHPFDSPTVEAMQALAETPSLVSALLRCTAPFDMTGHPAITLPGGFTAGMPLAFQLVAAHMNEATLVRAGAAFQGATTWHRRHPLD
ncbi:amidase [Variovorax sp. DXTD-1]|uniref:amidase n=1 Tax=Variovorax sp. DXTD-1 TaxID=2495592 RepID=UPI001C8D0DA4|nr:amidase [Variovorax sp. DXTD-1]